MVEIIFTDEIVSDFIENHVFRGYHEPWTSSDGTYSSPGGDWEASGWDAWAEQETSDGVGVQGLGIVRVIESFGGEGQGDDYYMIFHVDAGEWEEYYKLGGYYASFSGGYYEGPLCKTIPVVREVTFWE